MAIITPGESMTYAELFDGVQRFAVQIADHQPKASWLPVLVDRSPDSVVALLAVLRAGRPFVPIESSQPRERIREILTLIDTPQSAVLAKKEFNSLLPDGIQGITFQEGVHGTSDARPVEKHAPGMVFFTSGSTGRPKGVVLSWLGADRWLDRTAASGPSERLSVFRPLSFSGGFGQLTQVAGGTTLCMADPRLMTLQEILSFLNRSEVTSAQLGPALLEATLRLDDNGSILPHVQQISVQGRRSNWDDIEHLRRLCHESVRVVSGFASTETGRVAQFKVDESTHIQSGPLPNGLMPVDRLRLVECEEGQEIWVRDPDALEYLDDPELTMRRFVTDEEGTRWWRSGDFARVDDEGFLYLVGRTDDMVKINGMRVEPGEAESALRSIVGIGAAVVLAHPTSSGGHRLVGHVCVDDVSLTPEAVKMTLASTLPSHLVPAVLVRHDELPFNDRLKLDRQALLTMPIEPWRSTPPSRSTNDTVLWIASVAQQIIGLGEIAPNDDLWEVGLDSMGAVEVCAVIASQKLGDLEPTELLAFRTAVDLERRLAMKRSMSVSPSVSLNPEGSQTPIFAIPGGGGGSFAFRSLASAIGLDQPLVVIEPVGMHCKGGIESTIDQRVRTADKEITTRLQPGDPCLIMGYSAGATVATETARTLDGLGYRVHLVLLDGAPTDRIHYGYPVDWRGRRLPSRPDVGSISANTRWLKFRIRHSLRNIVDLPKALRLRLFPGKHRFTKDYYQLFGRMNRLSIRRHRLQPLDVPTTLFHITDSNSHEKCRPWLANLSVVEVGGDHHSMLLPPHVDKIAERVLMILGRGTIETA